MPPPSWLPKTPKAEDEAGFTSPDKNSANKYHTPLASLRPPELSNVDVTELFPEFRPGQVRYRYRYHCIITRELVSQVNLI